MTLNGAERPRRTTRFGIAAHTSSSRSHRCEGCSRSHAPVRATQGVPRLVDATRPRLRLAMEFA
jgi:hypothetical protein